MNEEALGNEWDLAEVTSERTQPRHTVFVYLSEEASYNKAQLLGSLDTINDPDEREKILDKVKEIEAIIEKTKYTIVLKGIPTRMRTDIHSKAATTHPILIDKDSFTDQNALARALCEQNLIWAAQIESITNPAGKTNREFSLEWIEKFSEALPAFAQNTIDTALRDLNVMSEKFTADSQNLDFLLGL